MPVVVDRRRVLVGALSRGLLVLLLLAGAAAPAAAQRGGALRPAQARGRTDSVLNDPVVEREARRGLELLYNMKFDRARRVFARIDGRYPEHPIGPFLLALNTWWEILIDLSDTSHDRAFYKAMDEVIDRSERLLEKDDDDFDAMFFKGAALGFRGRLRSNRGDWFKSARDGIRAMDYVLGVARAEPQNPDFAFGKGIYDYYAAVIPQRYPYVRPVMVFFPDGDRAKGLRELERTAAHGRYIQAEAVYFLVQIYYLFEQDFDKSVAHVSWLRGEYPDNSFFHTLEGRIYARWGYWSAVRRIFASVLQRHEDGQTGYNDAMGEQALYYLARSYMAYRDYRPALGYLERLAAASGPPGDAGYFGVLGRLRLGMVYDALGRRDEAVARYREVLRMKDWSGTHERARAYLEQPFR